MSRFAHQREYARLTKRAADGAQDWTRTEVPPECPHWIGPHQAERRGFTASTLLVGIMFWIPISSLRFSAEVSLLLSISMGVNALAAILLVPAMIVRLPERWARKLG